MSLESLQQTTFQACSGPGLIHHDWPAFIPVGGRTSYLGDVLAYVVADDRPTARLAAELVDITYDVLEPITDPRQAVEGADDAVWGLDGNVLSVSAYSRGDADVALAASAHVVTETFETQRVEQAFLEPESTLCTIAEDGRLLMYSGGQGVWDDRNLSAKVLGIDPSQIEVTLVSNGGAFGGKEDMSNQAQTALAAWLLQRPVKCTFSREESLIVHAKRHPIHLEYQAGCDTDGRLTAVRARMLGDSGPYASVGMKVIERAAGPRQRAVRGAKHRCQGGCGENQQLGLRGVQRIWRQPGSVCDGGRDGPPRRCCRHKRLGNAVKECCRTRRGVGPRSDHGRRLQRRKVVS